MAHETIHTKRETHPSWYSRAAALVWFRPGLRRKCIYLGAEGRGIRKRLTQGIFWVPFACWLAILLWRGTAGTLRIDLAHALFGGIGMVCLLFGRKQWISALLFALLLLPLGIHFGGHVPQAQALLSTPGAVWIEGTLRQRRALPAENEWNLLLGEVRLHRGTQEIALAEITLHLFTKAPWSLRYGKRLRVGGQLVRVWRKHGRLTLELHASGHYMPAPTLSWWRMEALRLRLSDRAAYYLSPEAQAVFLPLILGLRKARFPEARVIQSAFRRIGVAHLFAISGLHIGLLFLLLYQLWRIPELLWPRVMAIVPLRAWIRLSLLLPLWGYVLLIGMPVSAMRAAFMGSCWLIANLYGLRVDYTHVLFLTALGLLAVHPSDVYSLSFQFSFLAYWFLIAGLRVFPVHWFRSGEGRPSRVRRLGMALAVNLWITSAVFVGLAPHSAAVFGRLPLLVFAGNLLLVPMIGVSILPLGFLSLLVSLAYLGQPPGSGLEQTAFALLDLLLRLWVDAARWLARFADDWTLVFSRPWPPQAYAAYYAAWILFLPWMRSRMRRNLAAAEARAPMEVRL